MNKNPMKRKTPAAALTLLVVTVSMLALVLSSCEEKYSSPAERILAKSIRKMGGLKNATQWNTRLQKGILTVHAPGWGTLRAKYTINVKKPDMMKIDQDFSAFDHPFYYTYYYNNGMVWAEVNMNVRQHERYTSRVKENFREATEGSYYYLTSCDTFFIVENPGPDSLITEVDYDRVGCVMEGDTLLFDISRKSLLPIRVIEDGNRHLLMEDFRKCNGFEYPHKLTVYENGVKNSEVEWKEISFDQEMEDSIFEENMPEPEPEPEPEAEE